MKLCELDLDRQVNSLDLNNYGFGRWWPFNLAGEKNLLGNVPRNPGVYAVRHRQPYRRATGESDLLYIGSAANQQGLNMRLRQYFHPGPTQATNKRILTLVGKSADFEVSFVVTPSPARARGLEAELLERYESDHGELPPQNLRR